MSQPQQISGMIAFLQDSSPSSRLRPSPRPSYITYITGVSFKELTNAEAKSKVRWATISHSLCFIVGFSFVFVLMGASATYLGQLLVQYQYWIMKGRRGAHHPPGNPLHRNYQPSFFADGKKIRDEEETFGLCGFVRCGDSVCSGWTPCIGPILSTILIYASTSKSLSTGILLLTYYSIGLGIPFFLSSLAFNSFLSAFDRIKTIHEGHHRRERLFLIGIGILFLTDAFQEISSYLNLLGNP